MAKNKRRTKTTLNQLSRLRLAPNWITRYKGKYIVRGYAKHFKVDLLCAIKELRLCGVEVSTEYEAQVKQSFAARLKEKERKMRKKQEQELTEEEHWNGEFAFIAGYTSGGAPYGIRKDQLNEKGEFIPDSTDDLDFIFDSIKEDGVEDEFEHNKESEADTENQPEYSQDELPF